MTAHHAVLRPWQTDDAEAVHMAFASPDMASQGSVTDLESALTWVQQHLPAVQDRYSFAIDVEGVAVGAVTVSNVINSHRLGWFAYWLAPTHRGQGLMAAAACTVANWALEHAGVYRLELGHRVNNPASQRVAQAAGFILEGIEREKLLYDGVRHDVKTYSRLATDPTPPGPTLPLTGNPWLRSLSVDQST